MSTLSLPMFRALSAGLMLTSSLAAFCQAPNPEPNSGSPPVIQETVPPPFDKYPLGPDSYPHSSVPVSKIFKFDLIDSKIFPNTVRTITVYIPASYKSDRPACVYVGLDGLGYNVPIVFDNLIAQHAMPVMIAIGISPGTVSSSTRCVSGLVGCKLSCIRNLVNTLGDAVTNGMDSDAAECSVDHQVEDGDLFWCELFLRGHFILLEWQPVVISPRWAQTERAFDQVLLTTGSLHRRSIFSLARSALCRPGAV